MAKRTVLITGCSLGGLGDSLAQEFHRRGLQVFATGRNLSKLSHLPSPIQTLSLDVLSPDSIAQCAKTVAAQTGGSLDILINNSGGCYSIPLSDASIEEGKKLFDLNVWSVLAVTHAFLPLLMRSKHGGLIANQTSISSVTPNPMAGIYNMSKAAAAMLTDTLRLELAPFKIQVVDLKTGAVASNFFENQVCPSLPEGSIYTPAKELVEEVMGGAAVKKGMMDREEWARLVVGDLLGSKPPVRVWTGTNAWPVWFARRFMPFTFLDGQLSKLGALDVVSEKVAGRKV
jgi:1-acylglycerone phosphate reductase